MKVFSRAFVPTSLNGFQTKTSYCRVFDGRDDRVVDKWTPIEMAYVLQDHLWKEAQLTEFADCPNIRHSPN